MTEKKSIVKDNKIVKKVKVPKPKEPKEELVVLNVLNKTVAIPKPILKWVGGKTQILDKLLVKFPKSINNYHEIFLGGASVLLALLTYKNSNIINISGKIYAYDANETLINMYKNIQSNYNELYNSIETIITEFNGIKDDKTKQINRTPATLNIAKELRENYYYWIRSQYNKMVQEEKNSVKGSAMFIFLNKTCFRGVFRVGPNGFNVPYGHYKNPEIINKEHLVEIHKLIQPVTFECSDCINSLDNIEDGDYTYLDPPYAPEKETSFVGYTENGFSLNKHKELFAKLHSLNNKQKFMLSNADVALIRDSFKDKKYVINSVLCKRAINSKNPNASTNEVIITNY